jgi:hypothetical protein
MVNRHERRAGFGEAQRGILGLLALQQQRVLNGSRA